MPAKPAPRPPPLRNIEIVTTDTGYFKPGLPGRIVAGSERVVFLGPFGHETRHVIPEFSVELLDADGRVTSRMPFCQYGRDFVFKNCYDQTT